MSISNEAAADIGLKAIQYLAGDEEQLSRFIAICGVDIDQLREMASTQEFQGGVLEYLLGHEPTLLVFCENYNVLPQNVGLAYQVLGGPAGAGVGEFNP